MAEQNSPRQIPEESPIATPEEDYTETQQANRPIIDTLVRQAGTTGPPTIPVGARLDPTFQTVQQDELLQQTPGLKPISSDVIRTASTADLTTALPAQPSQISTTAATVSPGVQQLGAPDVAVGTVSADAVIGRIEGQISENAIARSATQELDEKATVQYQLGQLYRTLEAGDSLPAWAAPAARTANALMQKRGLGQSSMAAAAVVQALGESALPIAAADAQQYARIQLQNLDNEQKTALQNAAMFAGMDTANLNSRLTAAVNNAKSFLSIDTANLNNQQASNVLRYNAKLQGLFTDAAQENATQQFNAKNQAQVDQFFAELGNSVDASNRNRVAAMDQFNVDQENAMRQFIETSNNQRETFNTNLKLQIDQANAVWRRTINTQNTALQNEVNRVNMANLLGLTTSAQNALWQKYRDEAAWVFQMAENEAQRVHQFGLMAMEEDTNAALYDKQTMNNFALELGGAALGNVFKGLFGRS